MQLILYVLAGIGLATVVAIVAVFGVAACSIIPEYEEEDEP